MQRDSIISAVVFDMDGLMLNTEEIYTDVGRELLQRRGKTLSDELTDAMMGRTAREALAIMIQQCDLTDKVDQLQAESDEIFHHLAVMKLAPLPGLVELLDALEKESIPRAVATSSQRWYVSKLLSRFDLEPRFDFILSGDDVARGKPHPEIYQTAACQLDLPPAELMVLEDSENGCIAAMTAGTFTVAVPGKHSQNHNFAGVAFVANSLHDSRIYSALDIPHNG